MHKDASGSDKTTSRTAFNAASRGEGPDEKLAKAKLEYKPPIPAPAMPGPGHGGISHAPTPAPGGTEIDARALPMGPNPLNNQRANTEGEKTPRQQVTLRLAFQRAADRGRERDGGPDR